MISLMGPIPVPLSLNSHTKIILINQILVIIILTAMIVAAIIIRAEEIIIITRPPIIKIIITEAKILETILIIEINLYQRVTIVT
jgi:hypothetical protein